MLHIAATCALLIDVESPTCPIFWQLFFVLYFARSPQPPHNFFAQHIISSKMKGFVHHCHYQPQFNHLIFAPPPSSLPEKLRARLDYLCNFYNQKLGVAGHGHPSAPHLAHLLEIYRSMRLWLNADLNIARPETISRGISAPMAARLGGCLNYSGAIIACPRSLLTHSICRTARYLVGYAKPK